MPKNETTSPRVSRLASKQLRNKRSSKNIKSVAGSALTQKRNKK